MKYMIDYDIDELTVSEFKQHCSEEITDKTAICNYCKSFKPYCYTTESFSDKVTGKTVKDGYAGYFDGEYEWYDDWIYHFEKYNLKLNDDFIEHVLSRIK